MDSDGSSENELLRQTETLSPVGAISVHSDLRDNEISNPDVHFVNPIEPDAAYCVLSSRQDQMFPLLSEREIDRARLFGKEAQWKAGDVMYSMGCPSPGLIVLLSGHVRIVRRDAMGRVHRIFEYHAGQFLGEIAQLFGHPSLGDALVVEDTAAIVVHTDELRRLLVMEAEIGEKIMRALILRRTGLIERGSGPVLIGDSTDARLIELQDLLRRNSYPYTLVDAREDPETMALLQRVSATEADFPIVICPDGTVLRAPDVNQVATRLGWLPDLDPEHVYDVVIVGAGPAGLAAAVYAASEGLSVAIFDSWGPGGQAGTSARIENYLGFPAGISGQALTGRAYVQAQKFGVHISIPTRVNVLCCDRMPLEIKLEDSSHVTSHTMVIASGAAYTKPSIAGLERLAGRGVFFGTSPVEAKLCRGLEVAVVGAGNSAGQGIVYLASQSQHVHVLIRGHGLQEHMSQYLIDRITSLPNVTLHTETQVDSLADDAAGLCGVNCHAPHGPLSLSVRHLFLFTGAEPNTGWLKDCGVKTDAKGFVLTGADARDGFDQATCHSFETSVRGVFAIGDVRFGSVKRVSAAVGEGAAVVAQLHAVMGERQLLAKSAHDAERGTVAPAHADRND
jgi:thioredoxin reductase (NADPH)